jgi:DNA-binding transcriptional LysR family regulator
MKSPDDNPRANELPHLATFVRAAEQGSFTAAASELNITQAAVSQRIAVLEKELRGSLFDRRAGKLALTEAGQRLYAYAQEILELHRKARTELAGFRPSVSGDLVIAASSVPGEYFLPALLSAFHAKHPDVHVRATVTDSRSAIEDVERGKAALGLVGQTTEKPTLLARSIGSDSLVLVVSPAHPWASRRSISLNALAGESLIIRERGSGSRSAMEKGLERAGTPLAELNVALELGSNAAIKDAVKRGIGIAFLSRFAVQKELDATELQSLSVRKLHINREFYLVYPRRRPLTPSAQAFVRFLESHSLGQQARKQS